MHDGKAIIDEYLNGRRAARDGKPIPADASRHFLDGHHVEVHEQAIARAGEAYRRGEISAEALADVVKGKTPRV